MEGWHEARYVPPSWDGPALLSHIWTRMQRLGLMSAWDQIASRWCHCMPWMLKAEALTVVMGTKNISNLSLTAPCTTSRDRTKNPKFTGLMVLPCLYVSSNIRGPTIIYYINNFRTFFCMQSTSWGQHTPTLYCLKDTQKIARGT
jgi:hypothetical protein